MWNQLNSFSRQLKEQATHAAKEAGIDINLNTMSMNSRFANGLNFDDLTSKIVSIDNSTFSHHENIFMKSSEEYNSNMMGNEIDDGIKEINSKEISVEETEEYMALKEKLKLMENAAIEAFAELEETKEKLKVSEDRNNTIDADITRLRYDQCILENEIKDKDVEIENLIKININSESENIQLKEDLNSKENKIKEKGIELEKINLINEDLEREIENLKKEIKLKNSEIKKKDNKIKINEAKIEDYEKCLVEFEEKMGIKAEELKNAYIIINQINRQLKDLSEFTKAIDKAMKEKDLVLEEMKIRLNFDDELFLNITHEINQIINNDTFNLKSQESIIELLREKLSKNLEEIEKRKIISCNYENSSHDNNINYEPIILELNINDENRLSYDNNNNIIMEESIKLDNLNLLVKEYKEKLNVNEEQISMMQKKMDKAKENEEKYKKIAKDIKTKYITLKDSKKKILEEELRGKEAVYEEKIANLDNEYKNQIQSQLIELNQLKDIKLNLRQVEEDNRRLLNEFEEISKNRDQLKNEYNKMAEDMKVKDQISKERKAKFIILQNNFKKTEDALRDRIEHLEAENQEIKLKNNLENTEEISNKLKKLENELSNTKLELSEKDIFINNISKEKEILVYKVKELEMQIRDLCNNEIKLLNKELESSRDAIQHKDHEISTFDNKLKNTCQNLIIANSTIGELKLKIQKLEENIQVLEISKSEIKSQNKILEANNLAIAQELSQIQNKKIENNDPDVCENEIISNLKKELLEANGQIKDLRWQVKMLTESESDINHVISSNSNSLSDWIFGCVAQHRKNL